MNEAIFQHSIRVSPKAKNPRLKVAVKGGLEVIVPKGYDRAKVPALLYKKRHWITAALERIELNRKFLDPEPGWQLPESIVLVCHRAGMVPGKQTEQSKDGGRSGGRAKPASDFWTDPKREGMHGSSPTLAPSPGEGVTCSHT